MLCRSRLHLQSEFSLKEHYMQAKTWWAFLFVLQWGVVFKNIHIKKKNLLLFVIHSIKAIKMKQITLQKTSGF